MSADEVKVLLSRYIVERMGTRDERGNKLTFMLEPVANREDGLHHLIAKRESSDNPAKEFVDALDEFIPLVVAGSPPGDRLGTAYARLRAMVYPPLPDIEDETHGEVPGA